MTMNTLNFLALEKASSEDCQISTCIRVLTRNSGTLHNEDRKIQQL